jgi:hypothetical protein
LLEIRLERGVLCVLVLNLLLASVLLHREPNADKGKNEWDYEQL